MSDQKPRQITRTFPFGCVVAEMTNIDSRYTFTIYTFPPGQPERREVVRRGTRGYVHLEGAEREAAALQDLELIATVDPKVVAEELCENAYAPHRELLREREKRSRVPGDTHVAVRNPPSQRRDG